MTWTGLDDSTKRRLASSSSRLAYQDHLTQERSIKPAVKLKFIFFERGATKADHTVVAFVVDDINNRVSGLKLKGVVFEECDTRQLKTVDSVAKFGVIKGAWFRDTEGNNIEVAQLVNE